MKRESFEIGAARDGRVDPSAQAVGVVGSLKVLLVEDSRVLSERIAEFLREVPQVDLVDTVDTENIAIACIQRRRVDVVVLDLHLKEGTGFGVLNAIAGMRKKPRVIVLTNYDLPEYKRAATSLGATMFLDKARDYARLPACIVAMDQPP